MTEKQLFLAYINIHVYWCKFKHEKLKLGWGEGESQSISDA